MFGWRFYVLIYVSYECLQGHMNLVSKLAEVYAKNGIHLSPTEEVLVTVGAYQALFYSAMGYLNPGDEVSFGWRHFGYLSIKYKV